MENPFAGIGWPSCPTSPRPQRRAGNLPPAILARSAIIMSSQHYAREALAGDKNLEFRRAAKETRATPCAVGTAHFLEWIPDRNLPCARWIGGARVDVPTVLEPHRPDERLVPDAQPHRIQALAEREVAQR